MRIVCWQMSLMNYHTLFFPKFGKMLQNLPSAAVVIGALRVRMGIQYNLKKIMFKMFIWGGKSLD